ncbi:hypothetical protein AV530_008599 [Patagioenas fasciata monilis]|uniref:Uncharacterized protein n=1 Tax=Patagioenas fasciata monilis TaxID=372326 RepID=A0A1V4JG66_PATFA|nr:hypothetical protein AV530_008599 [Patagioenas fasciata monilis]
MGNARQTFILRPARRGSGKAAENGQRRRRRRAAGAQPARIPPSPQSAQCSHPSPPGASTASGALGHLFAPHPRGAAAAAAPIISYIAKDKSNAYACVIFNVNVFNCELES